MVPFKTLRLSSTLFIEQIFPCTQHYTPLSKIHPIDKINDNLTNIYIYDQDPRNLENLDRDFDKEENANNRKESKFKQCSQLYP